MSKSDVEVNIVSEQTNEYHNRLQERADSLSERLEQLRRKDWDELAARIHPTNVANGFWGDPEMMDKYVAKLMLVVTEIAEITEALRKSQGADRVTEEFSDAIIRLLDLFHVLVEVGEANPELYGILLDKIKKNAERPPKHGNRWG